MSNRVLVVDDDKDIVRVLRAYLEQAGYEVFIAYDGTTALSIIRHDRPEVVLLDWMLPDKDGLNIIQWVRADQLLARTHIIMLTARVDDTDKIVGLEVGADDYVTKPFNPREIVARVRSIFRRIELNDENDNQPILRYGALLLDIGRRHVTLNGDTIDLTPTEFNLLMTLMKRPGYPFTRADLVSKRLGYDYETIERTLDSHIRNLRKKIEPDPTNPTYVQTVYGVGYRLGEP
jgi:two-component system alkaline phosphatase synthesis response regulator PhoP